MSHVLENEIWTKLNFEGVSLGDKRRVNRLNKVVNKMLHSPEASLPKQMGSWSDTKAAYRLFNSGDATFNSVQSAHRKRIKEIARSSSRVVLFIEDSTVINFTSHPATKGLGPIGDHKGRGVVMHSCLAVEYDKDFPCVLGIPMQQIWTRREKPYVNNESRTERNNRHKESKIWATMLRRIGHPPEGKKWVEIGDRTNDIFEFMEYCRETGWNYVIRVCQDRVIITDEQIAKIEQTLSVLPAIGNTTINMRRKDATKIQTIKLNISYKEVKVMPLQRLKSKAEACKVWVVRAWNDKEEIDWKLYSSMAINSLEEAIEKLEWYATRWVIEEYHKCLKTGCKVEDRQLENIKGLSALIGTLAVIAVRLLELRDLSRRDGDKLARQIIPEAFLRIISRKYQLDETTMTLRIFYHKVAQLGGFLGRRSDGDPGWQTLWKGFMRLMDMSQGAELFLDMLGK